MSGFPDVLPNERAASADDGKAYSGHQNDSDPVYNIPLDYGFFHAAIPKAIDISGPTARQWRREFRRRKVQAA